ncbi:hypothetical protein ACJX0J_026146 [Zea mays]
MTIWQLGNILENLSIDILEKLFVFIANCEVVRLAYEIWADDPNVYCELNNDGLIVYIHVIVFVWEQSQQQHVEQDPNLQDLWSNARSILLRHFIFLSATHRNYNLIFIYLE